jgi:hypothetical protein
MSSTYSAALAVSVSGSSAQDFEQPHSVKSNRSNARCSPNTGLAFPVTPTSESSILYPPASFAEDSRANHSAPRPGGAASPSISGLKCSESSASPAPSTSSARTYKKRQSPTRLETSMDLAIARTTAVYRGLTAGLTIKEIVGGLLHTPTRKANFTAPSMQKWPSCRRFVLAFGGREITPEQFEFLMGLPIGWTELAPSETPSCRKSQKPSDAQS